MLRMLVDLSGRLVLVIEGIARIEDRLGARLNELDERIDALDGAVRLNQEQRDG